MVLIETKKYACETCIKGHRSSGCNHTDRPLYEIKKKGRPVTQCNHCRELRKTKQVHVKCICQKGDAVAVVEGEVASNSSKKGVNKMLESAAFPEGLPNALEASVALQLLSEGGTSDSDHDATDDCSCLSTGQECHCCTPRKPAARARRKGISTSEPPALIDNNIPASHSSGSPAPVHNQNTSHVVNRVPDFRAILPKPHHDPSSSATGPAMMRHHPHENMLYSPYGRAYDYSHPNHPNHSTLHTSQPHITSSELPSAAQDPIYHTSASLVDGSLPSPSGYSSFDGAANEAWNTLRMNSVTDVNSFCGCGDGCRCPNCVVHKPNAQVNGLDAASTCAQPDACGSCLDCGAFPPDLPANTALSIYDNSSVGDGGNDSSAIDEWIRQMQNSVPPFELPLAPERHSDSARDGSSGSSSNGQLLGDDDDGSASLLYALERGQYNVRSRSFDDVLSTSAFDGSRYTSLDDTLQPLNLSLFGGGGGSSYAGSTTLESVVDLADAIPHSRSASETPSEGSGNGNGPLNAFGDLGEMSSMSIFYHHAGTGAGGQRSVRSLPDLGYF